MIVIFLIIFSIGVYLVVYKITSGFRVHKGGLRSIKDHKISTRKSLRDAYLKDSYDMSQDEPHSKSKNSKRSEEIARRLEYHSNKNMIERYLNKIQYVYPNLKKTALCINIAILACILSVISIFVMPFPWYLSVASATGEAFLLSIVYFNYKYDKKLKCFLDNFIYALDIIVRGIRSGFMLNDCFHLIEKETDPVVAEQFILLRHDLRIGMSMEQAMVRMSERLPIKEVRFFTMVLMIQTKTGGNLAEVISNLAFILRQRKSILLRIQTLSQEAKTSAGVMIALPFAIIGILAMIATDYMAELLYTTIGQFILLGCGIWMMVGILIMRKMISFYK